MARSGKFNLTSVFICTHDEMVAAIKRKNKYALMSETAIPDNLDAETSLNVYAIENANPEELAAILD